MPADIRKLKDSANEAVAKGKYKKAAELFLELSRLEPHEPGWSHRAGELLKKLGRNEEAVASLMSAAEGYVRQGFLLKGLALAKVVLGVEPAHAGAKDLVEALSARLARPEPRRRGGAMSAASAVVGGTIDLKPAEPLSKLQLGRIVPGARPSREMPAVRAMEIPVELEIEVETCASDEARSVQPSGTMLAEEDVRPPAPPENALPAVAPAASAGVSAGAAAPAARAESPAGAAAPAARAESPAGAAAPGAAIAVDDAAAGLAAAASPPAGLPASPRARRDSVTDLGRVDHGVLAAPRVPLLSSLTPTELRYLVGHAEVVALSDGELVFAEGETDDSLYIVARGEVRAVRGSGTARVELERIGEGGFFGELALLSGAPRCASVVARGEATLLRFSRQTVSTVLEQFPEVLRELLRFFRARLVERFVDSSPIFQAFTREERRALVGLFRFLEIEAGSVVIRQGELSPGLFLLLAGQMDVVAAQNGEERNLATLGAGDVCGEMSLLTREPAVASIRAAAKCWALFAPRAEFHSLVLAHPQMLEYVAELAERRRRQNEATLDAPDLHADESMRVY